MQTKDFKGQDCRGRSFKNQDLTGADFSGCDLRGVDFSYSNLSDAKFCNARMGRTKKTGFALFLLQAVMGALFGIVLIILSLVFATITDEFLNDLIRYLVIKKFISEEMIWTTENLFKSIFIVNIETLIMVSACLYSVNKKKWEFVGWTFIIALSILSDIIIQ